MRFTQPRQQLPRDHRFFDTTKPANERAVLFIVDELGGWSDWINAIELSVPIGNVISEPVYLTHRRYWEIIEKLGGDESEDHF
jgi:hypothetical protein